jgi:inhibitor of KinA
MQPTIYPLGDRGLCIDWGNSIDPILNDQVLALHARLREAQLPGVLDLVPAYSSLGLLFATSKLVQGNPDQSPYEQLREQVIPHLTAASQSPALESRLLEIPVCYDPEFAPDLAELASNSGLPPEDVVQLHSAREYRVYHIGFLPGFPYLGAVDERIASPRRAVPRARIPAGSVGIAGQQTGIYPLESPGGWKLIGQTPIRLFRPQHPEPALLRAGDRVRFFSVSKKEFHQIAAAP